MYEGKLFSQYDHRYASYSCDMGDDQVVEVDEKDPGRAICFNRFISAKTALRRNPQLSQVPAILGLRDITNRTNERGIIAAVLPANITDYTVRVVRIEGEASRLLVLLSAFNSYLIDYLARQRIGGTHLSNYIIEQLPVLSEAACTPELLEFVVPRAFELTYTAWDLQPFAADLSYDGPPFRWDEERRFMMRCELDGAYFHLYGIGRDDVDYIMETFPIVRRRDEQAYGEYRTKRVILEVYDAMAEAMRTGEPYQTLLDPPPADPRVAHKDIRQGVK